jgi:hypothetical protein
MRQASALLALSIAACAAGASSAYAQQPGELPAQQPAGPEPVPAPPTPQASAPEESAPVAVGAQAPAQGPSPGAVPVPEPAPGPPAQPAPPPFSPPFPPQQQPAIPGGSTPTQAEQGTVTGGVAAPKGLALGLELGAGMTAGARFPDAQVMRSVEEAVDGTFGLSLWLGGRSAVYGLSVERTGLGKDHYATSASGATAQASFGVDTLSLLGRWYFTKERPAFYLGVSLGPSLPTARATGTRAMDGVMPGEPYSCSATGRVGGAASLSAGVEFEVAPGLAVLADARAAGFLMSRSDRAFGGCAPGTGPAVGGALRLGVSYRFGM